jgi:hypothetical protein
MELIVYQMLVGEPVKREDALQILVTLPQLIGEVYGLEEVDITLL